MFIENTNGHTGKGARKNLKADQTGDKKMKNSAGSQNEMEKNSINAKNKNVFHSHIFTIPRFILFLSIGLLSLPLSVLAVGDLPADERVLWVNGTYPFDYASNDGNGYIRDPLASTKLYDATIAAPLTHLLDVAVAGGKIYATEEGSGRILRFSSGWVFEDVLVDLTSSYLFYGLATNRFNGTGPADKLVVATTGGILEIPIATPLSYTVYGSNLYNDVDVAPEDYFALSGSGSSGAPTIVGTNQNTAEVDIFAMGGGGSYLGFAKSPSGAQTDNIGWVAVSQLGSVPTILFTYSINSGIIDGLAAFAVTSGAAGSAATDIPVGLDKRLGDAEWRPGRSAELALASIDGDAYFVQKRDPEISPSTLLAFAGLGAAISPDSPYEVAELAPDGGLVGTQINAITSYHLPKGSFVVTTPELAGVVPELPGGTVGFSLMALLMGGMVMLLRRITPAF